MKVSPVANGTLVTPSPALFATPVELAMLSPTDPPAVPGLTVTVQVVPLPLTPVIVAPVEPVSARFAAVSPLTLSLNVIVHDNEFALDGLLPTRLIERIFNILTFTAAESADVSPVAVKRSTYSVSSVPASVSPLNVATPATAFRVSVPPSVPPVPDPIATVTAAVAVVTVFPAESRIVTTGCVVSAFPVSPATGWVVSASCAAAPGVTVRFPVSTCVSPVAVKRRT